MSTEIGNAAERVAQSLRSEFDVCVLRACEKLARYCESPIEVMLGAALGVAGNLSNPGLVTIVPPSEKAPEKHGLLLLHPQYRWQNYRIDFAIVAKFGTIFVECDGHDFHERTKEQAEHDRRKDRAIQEAGLTVLRFTGSEIYRDAGACCVQIMDCLSGMIDRKGTSGGK